MEEHRDNIGLLRLVFASLVIVGHAPEMIDGNRTREPLTMLFHSLSLGELSVYAFFLISGYLIANSWTRSQSLARYLARRVLRIYPAFLVSFLICCFCFAPLVGAEPYSHWRETLLRMVILQIPPNYPGQLSGMHYAVLNGSMWTIAYEFRCYLLIAALGLCGLLRRRWVVLLLTGLGLVLMLLGGSWTIHTALRPVGLSRTARFAVGVPLDTVRLTTAFLVGVCLYLYRDVILPRLTGPIALGSAALACAFMYNDARFTRYADAPFAAPGLIVFGGLALFWLALIADIGRLRHINDRWDISYGVYLYGWPVATAICYFNAGISPIVLAAIALPTSFILGAASWWGIEKWAKDFGRLSPAGRRPAATFAPLRHGLQPVHDGSDPQSAPAGVSRAAEGQRT